MKCVYCESQRIDRIYFPTRDRLEVTRTHEDPCSIEHYLTIMDIITILRQDYAKFPIDQNYQIYAEDVYFQDPLTRFHGLDRYRKMVDFIQTWFKDPQLELYAIDRLDRLITTRWALRWNTPLPWYPRIEITGKTEMLLNDAHSEHLSQRDLIISHIDYWDCSPFDVLKQHFRGSRE